MKFGDLLSLFSPKQRIRINAYVYDADAGEMPCREFELIANDEVYKLSEVLVQLKDCTVWFVGYSTYHQQIVVHIQGNSVTGPITYEKLYFGTAAMCRHYCEANEKQ